MVILLLTIKVRYVIVKACLELLNTLVISSIGVKTWIQETISLWKICLSD